MGATIRANVGESGQILKITVEAKFKTLLDGQQGTPEGLEAVAGPSVTKVQGGGREEWALLPKQVRRR